MNLTEKTISFNGKKRLRPNQSEGYYIQYRLKTVDANFSQIAKRMKLTPQFVSLVVFGQRRSATIEAEIARILGKDSWNDVVMEARSEIQKKTLDATPEDDNATTVTQADGQDDFDRQFKERFEALGEAKQKKLFKKLRRVM